MHLHEYVHFPARVILYQYTGVKRAAGEEEDDGHHQIGDDCFFDLLMCLRDLDLGGDRYDDADADEEPLVLERCEDDTEPFWMLACVGGSC